VVGDREAAPSHLGIGLEIGQDGTKGILRGKIDRVEELGIVLAYTGIHVDPQEFTSEFPNAVGSLQGKAARKVQRLERFFDRLLRVLQARVKEGYLPGT
jgi:hypothetical protein